MLATASAVLVGVVSLDELTSSSFWKSCELAAEPTNVMIKMGIETFFTCVELVAVLAAQRMRRFAAAPDGFAFPAQVRGESLVVAGGGWWCVDDASPS